MTNIETHQDEHHSSLKDKLHHLADKLKHPHADDKGKQHADSLAVDTEPAPVTVNHPSTKPHSTSAEGESSLSKPEHHQDAHHHSDQADPVAEHSIVHKVVGDHPGSNLAGVGVGKQLI
ncbi:hypothetical protein BGZ73_001414 [Actinomortierella ambigua]|nr:hypothetical protein BGZ73_001414 [Actinomortierella ambigua]